MGERPDPCETMAEAVGDAVAGTAPARLPLRGRAFAPPKGARPVAAAIDAQAPFSGAELSAAPHRFDINGMILASAWPIPGATPAPAGAVPDAVALPGAVPPAPDDAPRIEDARLLGPGRALLESPGMRLLVEHGRRVTLDAPAVAEEAARLIIGYSAATPLALQRGGTPLHAAAAAGPHGAALLLGEGGAGKSTLAAMLERRGLQLVGDDLITVDAAAKTGAVVHRSLRTAKLWRDSAAAAQAAVGAAGGAAPAPRAVEGLEKAILSWTGDETAIPFPAPLRAVVALDWLHPPEAPPRLVPLTAMEALPLLMGATARAGLAEAMGLRGPLMARAARIAAAAPAYRLLRPRSFAAADAALDLVAALVRAPAPR